MSLSTLGNQLAALNAPGQNLGSSLPSSRRHEDAIGRGMSHSVQLGHSISKKNHLFKPSIIYEDARKAADVPLVTIRENCVSSLRHLESLDPEFGNFVDSLCKNSDPQERGLFTAAENERIDKLVEKLLYRLALRMGIGGNNSKVTTASCLHVVDYLLRRYDMHLRPKTAGVALLAMLPLHEEPFFLRLVQLIDLASLRTWAFLRPYAIPGGKVTRLVISKQASRDNALLRDICILAQRNSRLPNNMNSLSFSAAVVVEAVALQSRKFGSMEERTCQVVLPYVVDACRQSKQVGYRNWGHVTASAVVETSVLAQEAVDVLVVSILQGIIHSREMDQSNGLLVALAALSQSSDETDSKCYQLPVIGSSSYLGYPMSMKVFQTLLDVHDLPTRFGHLYRSDGIAEISHLIASCLVVGWKFLQTSNDSARKQKVGVLITEFIDEPSLERFWTMSSSKLVKSFCAFLIMNTSFDAEKLTGEDERCLNAVLRSLQSIDIVAYENGLASALVRKKKADRTRISSWLGLKRAGQEEGDSADGMQSGDSFVLPARIALEHADESVRLESIKRLIEDEADTDNVAMKGGGESLVHALMRRFTDDDDDKVVTAAGESLCKLFSMGWPYDTSAVGEASLQAAYKWTHSHSFNQGSRMAILSQAIHVVTHVAKKVMADGALNTLFVRLVECLAANCRSTDTRIAQQSEQSLRIIFIGQETKSKASKNLHFLLVSNTGLLRLFYRKLGMAGRVERNFRRLCTITILQGLLAALASGKQARSSLTLESTEEEAVNYCLWVVSSFADDLSEDEKTLLCQCLSKTMGYISSSPQRLRLVVNELTLRAGPILLECFSPLVISICDNVKDTNGGKVSGIGVLMELALTPSVSSVIVESLLKIAKEYTNLDRSGACIQLALTPALCLLGSENEVIRRLAVELISLINKHLPEDEESNWGVLSEICTFIEENKSSALMGDASFLPSCFASVVSRSANRSKLQRCILKLSVDASLTVSSEDGSKVGWLDASAAAGGHRVAATILAAAEEAGEECFPVSNRWQTAGKPILDGLLGSRSTGSRIAPSTSALIDVAIRMLRGEKVADSINQGESNANVTITSGPASTGGRARSYSFGKLDNTVFLKPYPKGMQEYIISILRKDGESPVEVEVQESLLLTVLLSKSWKLCVFPNLAKETRRKVALGVLALSMNGTVSSSDEVLFSLPLPANEVAEMITSQQLLPSLGALSYLADYVSMNSKQLISDGSVHTLFSALFKSLSELSSTLSNANEEVGFVQQSILSSLQELSDESSHSINGVDLVAETQFKSWLDLLISLLAGDSSNLRGIRTIRGKRTTLSLLTSLCSQYPSAVADKLIPAMEATLSNSQSLKEAGVLVECIGLIVPTYLNHATSADMSPLLLFTSFINATATKGDEQARIKQYQGFIGALPSVSKSRGSSCLVGDFASACLAAELYLSDREGKTSIGSTVLTIVSTQLLQNSSIHTKISAAWSMLGYGKEIILNLLGESLETNDRSSISVGDLLSLVSVGPSKRVTKKHLRDISKSKETKIKLCNLLLVAVGEAATSIQFNKFLRQLEASTSTEIFRFWQDLVLIQIACQNILGGSDKLDSGDFWNEVNGIVNGILRSLQSNLPPHIFLAFASSLMKEGGTEELRARAAQLIADGSISIHASAPEAGLFRDMLPFLNSLLDSPNSTERLLQQSAFVAIESIVRVLCLGTNKLKGNHQIVLAKAIARSAGLIQAEIAAFHGSTVRFEDVSRSSRQVVCSASLCAATCIRACGPQALASLPKLMKPLACFLSMANRFLCSGNFKGTEQTEAHMMQMAMLRTILAVTETLPLFLAPYLKDLFDPFGLPSEWLRKDPLVSVSVRGLTKSLDEAIVSHVPARIVIPAASKSLMTKEYDSGSLLSLLSLLNASTTKSKGSELSVHASTVLNVVTHVLEATDTRDGDDLFSASSDLFLALVLKLSEVQLRSLYFRLRDWRGDFDKLDPNKQATRRVAFWRLSASLSTQLKSIFLPCLGTVFSDAVDELDTAATELSRRTKAKKADGKKKQRLDSSNVSSYTAKSLESLQYLLLCLEVSLRSDAHNGGTWVRDAEFQRFESLLGPLGKLFQCQLPDESSSIGAYSILVQGTKETSGSVVDCVVSLASAAGDEQLWKPLNHSVLQAASNEARSEVRKAGVMCLASLIRSIGEEYMVLVPECLPVLSELLEDSDEEIVGLAQECISLSEEFLGESLQDSL